MVKSVAAVVIVVVATPLAGGVMSCVVKTVLIELVVTGAAAEGVMV